MQSQYGNVALLITEVHFQLRLFQRFCGFDPLRGYAEADLYMYLRALARAQGRLGVFFPSEGDEGMCYVNAGQLDFLLEEPTLLAQFRGSKEIAADFLAQFTAATATTEKVSLEVPQRFHNFTSH